MLHSNLDKGVPGGALALPDFLNSEKEQSLISAYQSLAITAASLDLKRYLHLTLLHMKKGIFLKVNQIDLQRQPYIFASVKILDHKVFKKKLESSQFCLL